MKIFITSYNRPEKHSTYFYLKKNGLNPKLVVYEEFAAAYSKNVPVEDIIVSGSYQKLNNLAKHRNWIIDNLVEEGEWHIQMSDDATEFFILDEKYYNQEKIDVKKEAKFFKDLYFTKFDFANFDKIVNELVEKAEKNRVRYAGWAITKNHFYRDRKWNLSGLIDGRFVLIKKSKLRWDENVSTVDDYQFSAENALQFGKVLRNNYFLPEFVRYGDGGVGSEKERFEKKKADLNYLIEKYPLFFAIKKRSGKQEFKIDLEFRIRRERLVDKWRVWMRNVRVK